jgi:hypothetical protein
MNDVYFDEVSGKLIIKDVSPVLHWLKILDEGQRLANQGKEK